MGNHNDSVELGGDGRRRSRAGHNRPVPCPLEQIHSRRAACAVASRAEPVRRHACVGELQCDARDDGGDGTGTTCYPTLSRGCTRTVVQRKKTLIHYLFTTTMMSMMVYGSKLLIEWKLT